MKSRSQNQAPFVKAGLLSSVILLSSCAEEKIITLNQDRALDRPTSVTLSIQGYCPREGFTYKDFWANTMSYRLTRGELLLDFDRDGVPDRYDSNPSIGLRPDSADTNKDGYSDITVYQGGFDLASQKAFQLCADPLLDTDRDGLTDCEEDNVLHTSSKKWDTDGDAIPDSLEVRFGLNPLDPGDAEQDAAGDGVSNFQKIKQNLPIAESTNELAKSFALQYSVIPIPGDPKNCLELKVSNIPLVNVSNGNLVRLYFFEVNGKGIRAMRSLPILIERLQPLVEDPSVLRVDYSSGGDAEWSTQ